MWRFRKSLKKRVEELEAKVQLLEEDRISIPPMYYRKIENRTVLYALLNYLELEIQEIPAKSGGIKLVKKDDTV